MFSAHFADALASGGALVVIDPATGAVIGTPRYGSYQTQSGQIEIGWTFLVRSHWGGTANPATKALMVGHALKSATRVVFMICETNIRSRQALKNIGGVLTDRIVDAMLDDALVRHVVYAIDAHDFAAGPLARLA